MTLCGCAQSLWKPVDNPCGKPAEKLEPAISLERDKSLSKGDPVVDALVDAVGLLAARVDGLEHQFAAFIGILDSPLSPVESIERLRQLRSEMP